MVLSSVRCRIWARGSACIPTEHSRSHLVLDSAGEGARGAPSTATWQLRIQWLSSKCAVDAENTWIECDGPGSKDAALHRICIHARQQTAQNRRSLLEVPAGRTLLAAVNAQANASASRAQNDLSFSFFMKSKSRLSFAGGPYAFKHLPRHCSAHRPPLLIGRAINLHKALVIISASCGTNQPAGCALHWREGNLRACEPPATSQRTFSFHRE